MITEQDRLDKVTREIADGYARLQRLHDEAMRAAIQRERVECAQAVCFACRQGYPVLPTPDGHYQHVHPDTSLYVADARCLASAIRDRERFA